MTESQVLGMGKLRVETTATGPREADALLEFDTFTSASDTAEDLDPFAVRTCRPSTLESLTSYHS